MRAGKLNRVISILKPGTALARSTDGAPIMSYTTFLKDIPAMVDNKTGSELYRDRNRWEIDEVDFYIRWSTHTIEPEYLLRYGSIDYDIKAVINIGDANREQHLITKRHK